MILDIDIGNSGVKWRLSDNVQLIDSGLERYQSSGSVAALDVACFSLVKLVRLSSVLDSHKCSERLARFPLPESVEILYAKVSSPYGQLRCAYDSVQDFGVDRWLAMLAVWERFSGEPTIVVDAGTAMTIDLIASDGKHMGGYIVPGLGLQRESLGAKTDLVNFNQQIDGSLMPGETTEQCVNRGVLNMLAGLIRSSRELLTSESGEEPVICLTGGDREHLARLFPKAKLSDNLVLDGLKVMFPVPLEGV